jgi:flavin reductase (DIM6/NTAB) family NADH-FMN oxidoreductase RutF
MLIDNLKFRRSLGKFATGVTVITTKCEDELVGITVNSFTSVSLTPPMILFCIDKHSSKLHFFNLGGYLAVNILSNTQQDISELFATHNPDFNKVKYFISSKHSMPIIENAIISLECKIAQIYDGGDHNIILAEIVEIHEKNENSKPLIYFASNYREIK